MHAVLLITGLCISALSQPPTDFIPRSVAIRPFTEWLVRAHPVHSDFRLSEPVYCYVNNLENGVILSYINDVIKIVAIQKSVLYNDDNLVIILSTFFLPTMTGEKD